MRNLSAVWSVRELGLVDQSEMPRQLIGDSSLFFAGSSLGSWFDVDPEWAFCEPFIIETG